MKALFIKTTAGTKMFNLDNVAAIEVEDDKLSVPSLNIFLAGEQSPYRIFLRKGTKEGAFLERLRLALIPLYEGRMANVLGVLMELDLTPLQTPPSMEPF